MNIVSKLKGFLSASRHDESGAVMPLIGLSFLVLVMASGFAIDYGRAQIVRERLQWAVDAGALAGAKLAPGGDLAAVQREANAYFRANFPSGYMDTRGGAISAQWISTVSGKGNGVRFTVSNMTMENYFADIVGIGDIKVSATADVNTLPISPLDLVFALDLSGSMRVVAGRGCTFLPYAPGCYTGGTLKLDDAKNAMRGLVDTLHSGSNVRFGLVGWSNIVNVYGSITGSYASYNCGGTRVSPVASSNPRAVSAGNAGPPQMDSNCLSFIPGTIQGSAPQERMQYFTSNRSTIEAAINRQTAEGNTDGALGMLFSYDMFRNTFGWAGATNVGAQNKAIVMLTDGVNTQYYGSPGGADASIYQSQSNNAQINLCTQAKNSGIVVYTIAYDMDDSDANRVSAKNMLRSCASRACSNNSGGICFFDARQSSQLNKAMQDIGNNMMTMRLTR